jgi:hypothetical protein
LEAIAMKTRLVVLLVLAGSLSIRPLRSAEPDSPQHADEWRGRRVTK